MPTTADSWSSSWIHSCSGVYLTVMGLLLCGLSAPVVIRCEERHGSDLHRHFSAAHDRVDARAVGRELRAHVAHRDRLVDARAEQAAGDFADRVAGVVLQFGVLAHR